MTTNITDLQDVSDKGPSLLSPAAKAKIPPGPSPLAELDQWVTGERLLEILWDAGSRPSLQWIRKETRRRMMPHIRRGRLIFYRPRSVMEWFNQRECRPNSMKQTPHSQPL